MNNKEKKANKFAIIIFFIAYSLVIILLSFYKEIEKTPKNIQPINKETTYKINKRYAVWIAAVENVESPGTLKKFQEKDNVTKEVFRLLTPADGNTKEAKELGLSVTDDQNGNLLITGSPLMHNYCANTLDEITQILDHVVDNKKYPDLKFYKITKTSLNKEKTKIFIKTKRNIDKKAGLDDPIAFLATGLTAELASFHNYSNAYYDKNQNLSQITCVVTTPKGEVQYNAEELFRY